MCEFSEKLIAWLDQELPAEQALDVTRHVEVCGDCRRHVELYRRLGDTINAYCDSVLVTNAKSNSSSRAWRAGFSAAAAAAAVLLFLHLRPDERLRSVFSPASDGIPAIALKAPPVSVPTLEKMAATAGAAEKTSKRIDARRVQRESVSQTLLSNGNANWPPNEGPIYIAIPADALFPPGAFPEGVGFVADVNLRADGSAQRLRLQPQLVGFQMRGTRP